MLEIQGLEVRRGTGQQSLLFSLPSLLLKAGEVIAITGESGCGKSTLLEAIGLLLTPEALGSYWLGFERQDINALLKANDQPALAAVRSRQIGFVLQSGGLLPFLKVRDNIALPRLMLGMPAHSALVDRAVSALRLEGLLDKLPHTLSIGERQRVACVRAIAHEPRLLLADEPTAALDPEGARRLFQLLLELVSELRISALIVSHDWPLVTEFGLSRLNAVNSAGGTRFEPLE